MVAKHLRSFPVCRDTLDSGADKRFWVAGGKFSSQSLVLGKSRVVVFQHEYERKPFESIPQGTPIMSSDIGHRKYCSLVAVRFLQQGSRCQSLMSEKGPA